MLRARWKTGVIAVVLLLLAACTVPRPVQSTIPVKFYASDNGQAKELVIFLPGRGDKIVAFERTGFIDILRQSNRSADSIVADTHMGYYMDPSFPKRVYEDILMPYHQKGYRRFIIVGVSLGGYGALWINHEYSDWITAIVLLAPYLGREPLIKKIESSDSIHAWRSGLELKPDYDERAWIWIDDMGKAGSCEIENVILASGRKDKFSRAAELLSTVIPDTHMFRNDGHHNWKTWRSLWLEIIKSDDWENLGFTK